MKLVKKHQTALQRQIREALDIGGSSAEIVLNKKSELNGSRIPRIVSMNKRRSRGKNKYILKRRKKIKEEEKSETTRGRKEMLMKLKWMSAAMRMMRRKKKS